MKSSIDISKAYKDKCIKFLKLKDMKHLNEVVERLNIHLLFLLGQKSPLALQINSPF